MSSHSSTDTTTSDWTSTSPTSMSSDDPLSRSTSQETDSTVGPDVDRGAFFIVSCVASTASNGVLGAEMTWVHYVALNRTQKRCVFKRKSNATRSSRRRKATQPRRVPTYEGYDSGEDGSRVGSPEPASRAEYRLMIISAMTKNSGALYVFSHDRALDLLACSIGSLCATRPSRHPTRNYVQGSEASAHARPGIEL